MADEGCSFVHAEHHGLPRTVTDMAEVLGASCSFEKQFRLVSQGSQATYPCILAINGLPEFAGD